MKRPLPSNEQLEISSDDSSSSSSSDADNDVFRSQQLNDGPPELSQEAWLSRRAQSYQEYMKLIPIPTNRSTVIPYTSWTGLGSSMKQIYEQPLHYLTNIQLRCMDQERLAGTAVPLYMIIHPCKAQASIWILRRPTADIIATSARQTVGSKYILSCAHRSHISPAEGLTSHPFVDDVGILFGFTYCLLFYSLCCLGS